MKYTGKGGYSFEVPEGWEKWSFVDMLKGKTNPMRNGLPQVDVSFHVKDRSASMNAIVGKIDEGIENYSSKNRKSGMHFYISAGLLGIDIKEIPNFTVDGEDAIYMTFRQKDIGYGRMLSTTDDDITEYIMQFRDKENSYAKNIDSIIDSFKFPRLARYGIKY